MHLWNFDLFILVVLHLYVFMDLGPVRFFSDVKVATAGVMDVNVAEMGEYSLAVVVIMSVLSAVGMNLTSAVVILVACDMGIPELIFE